MSSTTLLHTHWLAVSLIGLLAVGLGLPEASPAQSVNLYSGNSGRAALMDRDAGLNESLNLPGGSRKISLSASGENIRTVLRDLSRRGGFNLVMDDSVSGNVSVELANVTINQAVQAVATMADLRILPQDGGIYLAISRQAAMEKGLNRSLSKVIQVYYANANRIANILNRSLFADSTTASGSSSATAGGASSSGGGSNAFLRVKGDPRTNTIIVVGTARDIELAEAAVARLDKPRQHKTFYLSHGNALDVAAMISGSLFNDGTSAMTLGGSAGGTSGGGSQGGQTGQFSSMPSPLRVEKQDIQEGSGINNFGAGSSGGGSGQGSITSGLSSSVTLRGFVKSSDTLQISPEGPLVIPDTRQNAVTIFGSAEQIAQAEALIPTLDARLPQVSIEASLIEISETGVKDLGTRLGISDGRLQTGFNNVAQEGVQSAPHLPLSAQPAGTGLIGLPTVDPADTSAFGRSGIVFSTNPLARNSDYIVQIRALISKNKAKILANPTVVATHDTESLISIVDEVVRRVTVQLDSSGFATQTVEVGEAGIVMDILPKIGEDGTINMRLRPSVTSVLSQTRDSLNNLVTLLSKRDLLTQNVRVQDGQTLVIGGLIQQNDTLRQDKLPGLGELPIVGAMFRASQRNGKRSEIVMLLTPHILNKTIPTPAVSAAPPLTEVETPGFRTGDTSPGDASQ